MWENLYIWFNKLNEFNKINESQNVYEDALRAKHVKLYK